jgi:hypothetical protein
MNSPIIDIANEKFGKLLVIKRTNKRTSNGCVIWKCKCDCGKIKYINSKLLRYKKVTSCGCDNYIKCNICNGNFFRISNYQKYCSNKCYKLWKINYMKLYNKKYHRKYYILNKEKVEKQNKSYRKKNYKKCLERQEKYYQKNKQKILELVKIYHRNKRRMNINYRILCNLRTRIWRALKGKVKKSKRTRNLVGCSIDFLKQHLEKKFKKGMSWDNYGKWEIDHIIPCCKFDLKKIKEQHKCFHYTNLQPLWEKDNMIKGGRISEFLY